METYYEPTIRRTKGGRMTDDELLSLIKLWLKVAILEQEGLKEETACMEWPKWNKGYCACLEDLRGLIEEGKRPIQLPKEE